MTQNYGSSSQSHSDAGNSSVGDTTETQECLSSCRCSNAERRTSSDEVSCDSSMCATGSATSALLPALEPTSSEKCTNDSVVSLPLTSSAATETQAPADGGSCAQQLWASKPKGVSRAAVLDKCSASRSVSDVNFNGTATSVVCSGSGAASEIVANPTASQVCPCLTELPCCLPRTHSQPITGATTASASPDVATPSSTATTSPTREPNCSLTGVLTSSGQNAPKGPDVTSEKHPVPAVDRSHGELMHNQTSGDIPVLRRQAVEDIARNVLYEEGEQHVAANITAGADAFCIWPDERNFATASEEAPLALSAGDDNTVVPLASASPHLCLEEAVDTKAVATDVGNVAVAPGVGGSDVPTELAAVDKPLSAKSVEETERNKESTTVRVEEKSEQLHGQEHDRVDCHTNSITTGDEAQHSENDAPVTAAMAPTTQNDTTTTENLQQSPSFPSNHRDVTEKATDTAQHSCNREYTSNITDSTKSSRTSDAVVSANTQKTSSPVDERAGRLSDKLRAKFKREFNRSWVDINSAPSWPPIKKTKYLSSDWKIVDLRVGASQRHEKKKNRLFLNSLCYLFDGVYTQKSTLGRKAGLGLFCERPEGFRKGQIITEFVGWLVDREQAESYRKQRAASHIVAVQKGFLYIDGAKEPTYGMGGGSFANDGSEFLGGPGNNAHFYHWFDDELGRTRVFLRATADIKSGQEIFVPYERTYWVDNFEEQAENCPELFRKKKLEQLRKKFRHMEELHKNRLAANRRQQHLPRSSRASFAESNGAHAAPAKQKKEDRKICEKSNKIPGIKKPLSAYMLFSKERRRELLLQHYHPTETPQQTQQTKCFRAGPETDSTTSHSKSQTLMHQETNALGRHGMKGKEDRSAGAKIESQHQEIFTESTCSSSALEQQQQRHVSRLRSRRITNNSASVNTTTPRSDGVTAAVTPSCHNQKEETTRTRNNDSTRDDSADGLYNSAVVSDVAGESTNSSIDDKKQSARDTRIRRRSDRLIESAAAAARSLGVDCDAVVEAVSVRVEGEREESTATPAKKRTGKLETVERAATINDCRTVSERKGHRSETMEIVQKSVVDERRSPRRQQACGTAPDLPAATAVPEVKISGSVKDLGVSEMNGISAGRPKRMLVLRTDEVIEGESTRAGHGCDSKPRGADSTETGCPLVVRKPLSPSVLKKRTSETSSSSAIDSAEGTTSAPQHSAVAQEIPAKSESEEKMEQKRKNQRTDPSRGSSAVAEFVESNNADTGVQDNKRNAVLQHFASVIRRVANEWTTMPAQERRKWERLAAREKERYMRLLHKTSRKKSRRRDTEQPNCYNKKKPVSSITKEKVQHAHKRMVKVAASTTAAAAPTRMSQKVASRKATPSAHCVAAATVINSTLPAEGAEFVGSLETEHSSKKAGAHERTTRMRQRVSKVDEHPVKGTEDNNKQQQADTSKKADASTLRRKRCITRAAKCAAGDAADQNVPKQKRRFFSEEAVEEQHLKAEDSSDSQQTGERKHHCKARAAQEIRRGRRRIDMTEAAVTDNQEDDDSMSCQRQDLFLPYSSVSSVTSCSTTRSSSSRNSSCESRNHRNADTRLDWRTRENERNLAVSPNERSDDSVQSDGVCEMLDGQPCTRETEQQGVEPQGLKQVVEDQHKHKQEEQQSEKVLGHPGRDQQQQQREGSQQRVADRKQESCSRKGILLCLREQRTKGTRRRSWSPLRAGPDDQAVPAASQNISDKKRCHTVEVMPAGKFSTSSVSRNALASAMTNTERAKAQGAIIVRRRSADCSIWNTSSRVEQASIAGSTSGSRKRDRTRDCSSGEQQGLKRHCGIVQGREVQD